LEKEKRTWVEEGKRTERGGAIKRGGNETPQERDTDERSSGNENNDLKGMKVKKINKALE